MLWVIIYLFFSFILEGFMSNIFFSTLSDVSIFSTIYTIVAVVVIYPYFMNEKKYFLIVGFWGLLFDFVYTSTFPLNLLIFLLIGFIVKLLNNLLQSNVLTNNLISFLCIVFYHIFSFVILTIVEYGDYNIMLLFNIIIHSILMTLIYATVGYFIFKLIFSKFGLKQIK